MSFPFRVGTSCIAFVLIAGSIACAADTSKADSTSTAGSDADIGLVHRRVKSDLNAAVMRLAGAEDWKSYLQIDELHSALESPLDSNLESIFQAIEFTRKRLIGLHPGLEVQELMDLRNSLNTLSKTLEVELRGTEFRDSLSESRDRLLELTNRDREINSATYRQLAADAAWLEQYGQAPELVSRLKSEFNNPNVILSISSHALELITERDVYENEPIDKTQDGRKITGQAIATGRAFLQPVFGNGAGLGQVVFQGNIESTLNTGQGPASVKLVGNTSLTAVRPVHFSAASFDLDETIPSSCTSLRTAAICTKRNGVGSRLIKRIANRVVEKERPEATSDLNMEVVETFTQQFDEEISAEIRAAETDFQKEVFAPLQRLDLNPSNIQFVSSDSDLKIAYRLDGGYGLAAPTPPRYVPSDSIGVLVHESAINRIADRLLAGESFDELAKVLDEFGIKLPEEELDKLPTDLGVDFAERQPITAKFENNMLEITISGDRFRVGKALLVAMNAVIRYEVVQANGETKLVLAGEPEVLPPKNGKSGRFILQRNILKRRLSKELPAEYVVEPFKLPEPGDRLGELQIQNFKTDDGWLQLSFSP